MDPAKLSRIINGLASPSDEDKRRLAAHLKTTQKKLFPRG